MLIRLIIFSSLLWQTNAVQFQVDGRLECSFHPEGTNANVQLWEEDTFPPDDYMGEVLVRQNRFQLEFDQTEIGGVEPYIVIRHDCVPEWWKTGSKDEAFKYCYVQERRSFPEPSGSVASLQFRIGNNNYKDMEICVGEGEFYRLFSKF